MRLRSWIVASLALVLCGPGSSRSAYAAPELRTLVSTAALNFVVQELTDKLSQHYQLGDFGGELYSCLGRDASAHLRDVTFDATLKALEVEPRDGRLTVTFYTSIEGSARVRAENLLCLFGDDSCNLRFRALRVPAVVEIEPRVLEGGVVEFATSDVIVGLETYNIDLDFSGCGAVGGLTAAVLSIFETELVAELREELEQGAVQELVEALEELFADFSSIDGTRGGVAFSAQTTDVPIDDHGIGLDMAVEIEAVESAACVTAPPSAGYPSPSTEPTLAFKADHLGLALSRAMLQQAMTEAWRAGRLCIAQQSSLLGGLVSISLAEPPQLSLVPGTEPQLQLLLRDLQLTIGADGATTATLDVKVRLGLRPDLSGAMLLTDPHVTLERLRIDQQRDTLLDYPQLIARAAPPLIRGALDETVLLPRTYHRSGRVLGDLFLSLARAQATSDYLQLYLMFTRRPTDDATPPETELVGTPDGWTGTTTRLVALGRDDKTPAPLLRHRWRVDGGPWVDTDLGRRFWVELEDGQHTVEVAAIDLSDNVDATPASTTFEVDSVAPRLALTKVPPEDLADQRFLVAFETEDDRTPSAEITVHVLFEREVDPESEQLSRLEDSVAGLNELKLHALGAGLHTLSLVAEDRAGNRSAPVHASLRGIELSTSEENQPVQTPPTAERGACALAAKHSAPAAGWPAILLLFGLVALRRLRGQKRQNRSS